MKSYLILISLCVYNVSFCQTTKDLDAKGGFKGFKIGATLQSILNEYGGSVKYLDTEKNTKDGIPLVIYKYDDQNPISAFEHKVEWLQLEFKSNKLFKIWMRVISPFGERFTEEGDFHNVLINIKQAFGKPTIERKTIYEEYEWVGQKIKLILHGSQNESKYFMWISVGQVGKNKVDF